MRYEKAFRRLVTLVPGILISYFLLGPLATVAFFLIWFDIVFMFTKGLQSIGIDLTTIVAIIYGIALGPVFGFLFSVTLLPLIIIVLMLILFNFDEPILNVEFIYLGFASMFAGLIAPFLPLFVTVMAALLFRFGLSVFISTQFRKNLNVGYYLINTLASSMIIIFLNSAGLFLVLG